ncbi:hypothetical protein HPB48_023380 [Haemaphysalis longicornis]|uniref:Uncharacterized protein n=1 Tax=Haemaphysalis longicornis TaxID=44386 RepID=A0A9J6H703_HAELO|nr:hypothetical protein HPB48_023380 [Haemaphysalis longicornis]
MEEMFAPRPMGRPGTILITFASPSPPREVSYWSFRRTVRQFKQRALVCLRYHRPGHKAATCPAGTAVCGKCGKQHGETPDDCSNNGAKYCVRCKHVGHLAIEPECPAKAKYRKNTKKCELSRTATYSSGRSKYQHHAWQNSSGVDSASATPVKYSTGTVRTEENAESNNELLATDDRECTDAEHRCRDLARERQHKRAAFEERLIELVQQIGQLRIEYSHWEEAQENLLRTAQDKAAEVHCKQDEYVEHCKLDAERQHPDISLQVKPSIQPASSASQTQPPNHQNSQVIHVIPVATEQRHQLATTVTTDNKGNLPHGCTVF